MRRMMHAAVLVLAVASAANATPPQLRRISAQTVATSSDSPASASDQSVNGEDIPSPGIQPVAPSMDAPINYGYGAPHPHSPLGVYMRCSDYGPNLWRGYAAERAAAQMRLNQHVDGRCDCFNGGHRLHTHAHACCGQGGGCDTGTCNTGCGTLTKVNRYKTGGFSQLYAAPSSACGADCGTGCLGGPHSLHVKPLIRSQYECSADTPCASLTPMGSSMQSPSEMASQNSPKTASVLPGTWQNSKR